MAKAQMTPEQPMIGKVTLYEGESELSSETIDQVQSEKISPQVQSEKISPQVQGEKISAAVEVAKLAWDIVKSGNAVARAEGNFTNVLGKSDTNPLNYQNSRKFESQEYTVKADSYGGHGPTMATLKYQIVGDYHATYTGSSEDVEQGLYIPNIHIKIIKASTMFGVDLNAKAMVSENVVNVGKSGEVVPEITVGIEVKFDAVNAIIRNFWYRINAKDGFIGPT